MSSRSVICRCVLGLLACTVLEAVRGDEIGDLKKRVAALEAELADVRAALLRAARPDDFTDLKRVAEVAKLRADDLLLATRNVRAILDDVLNGKVKRINDLNNDLADLWLKLAGHGLGRDPFLDNVQLGAGGFNKPKLPPTYGVPGPHQSIGLPRLHERFLEGAKVDAKNAAKKRADFKKIVEPYSNPAVYPFRDFYERAYEDYRNGVGLFTPQYAADMKMVTQWLIDLEAGLTTLPGYFEVGEGGKKRP